jgi:protocatechuate 3,4-dioxygenase beta subunit
MTDDDNATRSRRTVLKAGVVGAATIGLGVAGLAAAQADPAMAGVLTPSCVDDDDTPSNIEGPYFKRSSPLRTNLVTAGVTGVLLTLTGAVRNEQCQPVANALLDFWQADAKGAYDNSGFKLRGHQFTGADGTYVLQTVVPKDYPGRTPHIHVKVQAANGPILTTQLFFPDNLKAYGMNVARLNARDRFINRHCVVQLGPPGSNRYDATFEYVIAVG